MVKPEILDPTPLHNLYLMQMASGETIAASHPDLWIQNQPKEVRLAVYEGKMACPACQGQRNTVGFYTTGETDVVLLPRPGEENQKAWVPDWGRGEIPCPCKRHRAAWQGFRRLTNGFDFFFDDRVQLVKLHPYGTSQKEKDFSASVLEHVKNDPLRSYFMFGPPHRGKTTISRALTREAVKHQAETAFWKPESNRLPRISVIRQEVNQLVAEWHQEMMNRGNRDFDDPRQVTIEKITADDEDIPRLHLSEMDKVGKVTDTRRDTLHTILNALYERWKSGRGAQLVGDTNMTLEEFESAENFGDKMAWRIAEMCVRFDFFNLEIHEPKG